MSRRKQPCPKRKADDLIDVDLKLANDETADAPEPGTSCIGADSSTNDFTDDSPLDLSTKRRRRAISAHSCNDSIGTNTVAEPSLKRQPASSHAPKATSFTVLDLLNHASSSNTGKTTDESRPPTISILPTCGGDRLQKRQGSSFVTAAPDNVDGGGNGGTAANALDRLNLLVSTLGDRPRTADASRVQNGAASMARLAAVSQPLSALTASVENAGCDDRRSAGLTPNQMAAPNGLSMQDLWLKYMKKEESAELKRINEAKRIFTCLQCRDSFQTMDQLVKHMQTTQHFANVPKHYSWQLQYARQRMRQMKMKLKYSDQVRYFCHLCSSAFGVPVHQHFSESHDMHNPVENMNFVQLITSPSAVDKHQQPHRPTISPDSSTTIDSLSPPTPRSLLSSPTALSEVTALPLLATSSASGKDLLHKMEQLVKSAVIKEK